MAWLLNIVYLALIAVISPVLLYKRFVLGKYRHGWAHKLHGKVPRRNSERRCAWFHAVSVGEVLQLQRIIPQFRAERPEFDVVLTTTTATGYELATKRFDDCLVCYCPLDFSWAVSRALRRLRPEILVLVELELWPNMIRAAYSYGARLMLINGRVSSRSYRGYRRIRPLLKWLLRRFDLLAVQNETYAQRLIELGADPQRVHVTGSVKCDALVFDRANPKTIALRSALGLAADQRVFVAGSTQAPEEAIALRCYERLVRQFPDLRCILVPRHPERFGEIAQLVEHQGWQLIRRSQPAADEPLRNRHPDRHPIVLLDTMGELAACWGLADVAFVGGSLTTRGGQNMMEPAAYGAAVCFGPNTQNFRDVVDLLLQENAAVVVDDEQQLWHAVQRLLTDPQLARDMGGRAQQVLLAQQGATQRTLDLFEHVLGPVAHQRPQNLPRAA